MPLYPMKFAFTPGKNERIEAIVTIPEELRSIVHGTVYDMEGNKVKDAVVRLFLYEAEKQEPVSHTFTDSDGEFIFGPLAADKHYIVKVHVNGVTLREMAIRPRKKKS
ncbi:MAG: carboxypeptidase-like regulatory domain-containing protein [Eubacteriales bacterium]|nr:carboxypeptidase-like regulatory domain-containing protein [Eubacteriales bacterium]